MVEIHSFPPKSEDQLYISDHIIRSDQERPRLPNVIISKVKMQSIRFLTGNQISSSKVRIRQVPQTYADYSSFFWINHSEPTSKLNHFISGKKTMDSNAKQKIFCFDPESCNYFNPGFFIRKKNSTNWNNDLQIQLSSAIIAEKISESLASIYGFLSSISHLSIDDEDYFYYVVSNMPFRFKDLYHIYHLIDEIYICNRFKEANIRFFTLFQINFPYYQDLIKSLFSNYHLIPLIQPLSSPKAIIPPTPFNLPIPDCYKGCDDLINILQSSSQNLPYLLPVGEGLFFDSKSSNIHPPGMKTKNNQKKLPVTIQTLQNYVSHEMWFETVICATKLLKKDPEQEEVLFLRALGLLQCLKTHDALIDITHAISIEKKDRSLSLRAAIWLKLGQTDLALKDAFQISNKIQAKKIIDICFPESK